MEGTFGSGKIIKLTEKHLASYIASYLRGEDLCVPSQTIMLSSVIKQTGSVINIHSYMLKTLFSAMKMWNINLSFLTLRGLLCTLHE